MKVSSKIIADEYSMKRSMIEVLPNYKLSDEKANMDGNSYSPQQKIVIKGEERINNFIKTMATILLLALAPLSLQL